MDDCMEMEKELRGNERWTDVWMYWCNIRRICRK